MTTACPYFSSGTSSPNSSNSSAPGTGRGLAYVVGAAVLARYLVKGNVVDGTVDLTEQANPPDADGLSTGTIHISGVPTDPEIVAARNCQSLA